jgi:hypothetical protein
MERCLAGEAGAAQGDVAANALAWAVLYRLPIGTWGRGSAPSSLCKIDDQVQFPNRIDTEHR